MADITLTRSGELMIVEAQGNTEAGTDFVDAWITADPEAMYVHDLGQIFIRPDEVERVEKAAVKAGLTVEHDLIASEKPGGGA